ncbi:sugar ABC transporter ATP-binding protein [Haloglomus irregulare]|jgi:multiple sugar transport system ATP-binding protein|uniref:ABC-type D-xylose/L-arabinose transporter n=1 Tax=Haloglomus irregulare TaxID=2234134 RepID=A0A554NBU5_9EURY|nr:sn-glycerol-3-phosphate ABC transporter ATP-binding protein UgpC [Haloglomus irregulare]TSD14852.1 sugar ABC transporter ATP-binding protein [Haloglomus irregulare]
MAALTLADVTKVFSDGSDDAVIAVDGVDMEIRDGEFLVLVGPSGCGKSTTLRMIAGLESVTQGEIRLGDRRINDVAPADRNIAMVFQSYALYPHMTVRENMSFGLEESTGMADAEVAATVEESASMMGIEELLDRKPSDLSGGQQQRVALGRAIVRDPEAFLMDEPLSNLDAKLRATMRTELQRIQEELGVTTVYVTHDQTEAMTMGDRIAVLDEGVLQQVGTPLECYHEPANRFVAGFIGEPSMNFFDVERQGTRLVADRFDYPLSEATHAALGDTTELALGIRPEDIELVGEPGDHAFETVVDVVEPMGDANACYLTFDRSGTDPETFVATVGGMQQVEAGQPAVAHLPESAIHLFDRATGEALRNRDLPDDDGVQQAVRSD